MDMDSLKALLKRAFPEQTLEVQECGNGEVAVVAPRGVISVSLGSQTARIRSRVIWTGLPDKQSVSKWSWIAKLMHEV